MNPKFAEQLKTYLAAQREANKLQDADDTPEATLAESFGLVDVELEKVILALDDLEAGEAGEAGDGGDDSEAAEIYELYQQADPTRYIQLTADEKPLDGAESELSAALKMARPNTMPLGMLLPEHERGAEWSEKPDLELADAVTSITTETTVNTSPIAARVFKATAARLLGVQMPTVPSGIQRYPFLTAGTTAGVVATGASRDASAATLGIVEVDPVAIQGTYILDRDSIMLHGGELRTLLETDLRMVMASALDDEILRGDGSTPTRTKGLFPFIKDVTISGADVETRTTWTEAESIAAEFVDGRYFMEDTPTRMLIGISTFKFLRRLFPPRTGSVYFPTPHALGAIRQDGVSVFSRDRVPAAVAASSGNNGKYQDSLYLGGEGPGNILVPVWNDVDLLVDPYTGGRRRQVQLTVSMFFGIAYRRRTLDGTDDTIGSIPGAKKIRWVETDDA